MESPADLISGAFFILPLWLVFSPTNISHQPIYLTNQYISPTVLSVELSAAAPMFTNVEESEDSSTEILQWLKFTATIGNSVVGEEQQPQEPT